MTPNEARAYSYLAGVFRNQQRDPLCGQCKAFVNSAAALRERLDGFHRDDSAARGLPDSLVRQLTEAITIFNSLNLPAGALGQKRAGNCLLPPGVCFIKTSVSSFSSFMNQK